MSHASFEGFDQIQLLGVRAFGHHGVLPEENTNGQWFVVDATIHAELRRAAATDDLNDTIDYAQAAALIDDAITGEPVQLIEALAERIANRLLELPLVQVVEITVHKPEAPILSQFSDVSVTIVRAR